PLQSESQLLADRTRADNGRFTRIDTVQENVQRMLQINSLIGRSDSVEKVRRYRRRIIDSCSTDGAGFEQLLQKTFGMSGLRALDALKAEDMSKFARRMRMAKLSFSLRYWARRPIDAAHRLFSRGIYRWRILWLSQCGFVLKVHAPAEDDRCRLREALDLLREANMLYSWTDRNSERGRITWAERKVMDRGGIAIKYRRPGDVQLDVDRIRDEQELAMSIMELLIRRHKVLFYREDAAR
ncbi:hypothetical protein LCGC14_2798940, partial [marine sediment metagenome]